MKIISILLVIALLGFIVYQGIGVVKDIKKNRQKKKDSIEEKEKTE